ncbi:hypothetical protein QBC40DRAFT_274140 [Triangularia verruculosa]|uniref:Fe2OG dioxygenase domain-containing protein n=1 Tax=Triangularia verruculosa TaxID=2587418 RepID=A0AAN7AZ76_9PEZI|nr:hypothetical protein QBC40DRAFT_274140 [Triangularia verruculosa]
MANKIAKIPVIDISGEGDQEQIARDLVEAAIEHGFIYIKNTGKDIPAEAVDGAFNLGRTIFKAPLSEKQACTIQKNNRGWSAMQYETLDPSTQRVGDFKEAFNFGEFIHGKADQPIPATIAPYESQINDFGELCYKLCLKINTLLGIGLQVSPPDFFTNAHLREKGASGTILRFLRYPPHTETDADREADVRAGAHSDYGSMTLLFRLKGQAGLEILSQDGKTWAPVPVVPPGTENDPSPPILLNIGDLLSYWTNGLLRSTVHRVVFPGPGKTSVEGETDSEPRYSIAFFCHPVATTPLEPVPSERVRIHKGDAQAKQENPYAEKKVLTADEHLQMRLKASYLQLYKDKE